MAIAFNIPSEREPSEENFSRLNRLLAELYEVLCHILVSRQPSQDSQEQRRDRPFSDSDIERPGISGLSEITNQSIQRPRPLSTSAPLPILNLDFSDLEDDVFVSPRTDQGNDPFSHPLNMEIFGNPRNGSPRTPAGVLLSPRRERRFTFSGTSEKHWKDKGGTDEADGLRSGRRQRRTVNDDSDETDATTEEPSTSKTSSESSIFSILPDKISGSICTAVLFMLGWKLLSKR